MVKLAEIQERISELSEEDRQSLIAYLLNDTAIEVSSVSDEEVLLREEEMDLSAVNLVPFETFKKIVKE